MRTNVPQFCRIFGKYIWDIIYDKSIENAYEIPYVRIQSQIQTPPYNKNKPNKYDNLEKYKYEPFFLT